MRFLLLFLVLFPIDKVLGKTYYSEYSEFSEFSEDKVEETDTVNVEVERRYKWYRNVADWDFFLLPGPSGSFPYVNVNIFQDLPFSEWSLVYPEDKYSRLIETRTVCDNDDCSLSHQEYRYQDRLYYHYNILEKESEEYSLYGKGFVKRSDKYKDYYRYQIREKIEIPEQIVITDSSKNINDYIASTSDYKVEGNVNYRENGTYPVKIINNFLEVTVDVQVLIEENIRNDYEAMIKELRDSMLNKQESIKKLDNDNVLLQESLKALEKNYLELLEQKKSLLKKQDDLNSELQNKEEEKIKQSETMQLQEKQFQQKYEQLETSLENQGQNLLQLQKELSLKEKTILLLEQSLEESKVKTIFVDTDNYKQKYEDISKKLVLCNQTIDSMQSVQEEPKNIKKQSIYYIFFGQALLLLIITFFWKIKSMKKKN